MEIKVWKWFKKPSKYHTNCKWAFYFIFRLLKILWYWTL